MWRAISLSLVLCCAGKAQSNDVGYLEWLRAARNADIPVSVLYAIAKRESGKKVGKVFAPYPLAMNINGTSIFPETIEDAKKKLRVALANSVKQIDVGMMQINLGWNGHRVHSFEDLFDAKKNLDTAVLVLNDCKKRFGIELRSILACYHNGSETARGLQYADEVLQMASLTNHVAGGVRFEYLEKPKHTTNGVAGLDLPVMKAETAPRDLLAALRVRYDNQDNQDVDEIRIF